MAGLNDLLNWLDNKRRVAGRNISDLVRNPRDSMDQTADNLRVTAQEMIQDPAEFIGGGLGKIAYHGSPHKFAKFQMDKIGTGEGAQAYGHGLYLAESPEVAKAYANVLTKNAFFDGKPIYEIDPNTLGRRETILSGVQNMGNDARGAIPGRYTPQGLDAEYSGPIAAMRALIKSGKVPKNATKWLDENGNIKVSSVEPQLYKTDIPDEAVARMLDWDKPLSQQAPEVQKALKTVVDSKHGSGTWDEWVKNSPDFRDFRNDLMETVPEGEISKQLLQQGIPGIRYLDGGSRGAGEGTSNFVSFDPDMIRILERNGEATGLKPWVPGEWEGALNQLKNQK